MTDNSSHYAYATLGATCSPLSVNIVRASVDTRTPSLGVFYE